MYMSLYFQMAENASADLNIYGRFSPNIQNRFALRMK